MRKKKMKKAAKGKARTASRSKAASKPMTKKTAKSAKRKVAKKVTAVPAGYQTVTPYLVCRNAPDAIAFYAKAFGAKERARMLGPDGKIAHAELRIGSSMVMMSDEVMGQRSPETIGGAGVQMFLYVPSVDKSYAQAVAAGATPEMPPVDMFWGDRFAKVGDPFGHQWSIATHIEDVSPKEMERRGAAWAAEMALAGGQ